MYEWIGTLLSSDKYQSPRRVIAIDIRGCGDSGMPERGFTLPHLASDIEAVMEHLGIKQAHFIAYSRGVAYALQYALIHPDNVHGLVIGDFPTYYPKFNEDWAKRMVDSYTIYETWDHLYNVLAESENLSREEFEARKEVFYKEKEGKIVKRYSKDFPIRLQRESADFDLSSALDAIKGKLLVLKGTEPGSLLNEDQMKVYQAYNAEIVRVDQAGHDVFEPRKQVQDVLTEFFKNSI